MSVVGTLAVKIVGDSSDLDRTLNNSQASIKRFGLAAAGVAATAATTLGVMVRRTISAMDEMAKASRRVGIAVEELSALKFQADFSSVSMQQLESSVIRLSRSMTQAAQGNQQSTELFRRLGVSVQDSNGQLRNTHDVLLDVADAFQRMEDGTLKVATAQELFRNTSIINMLNEGSEGMRRASARAEELGLIIRQDMAEAAEMFENNMTEMRKHLDSFTMYIANATLPRLNDLFARLRLFQQTGEILFLNPRHIRDATAGIDELTARLGHLRDEQLGLSGGGDVSRNLRLRQIQDEIDQIDKQIASLEVLKATRDATLPEVTVEPPDSFVRPSGVKDPNKERLEAVKRLVIEYERERNFQLEMMAIQQQMVGMTKDQAAVQQVVNDVLIATSRSLQDIADKRLEAANLGASQAILDQFDKEAAKVQELADEYVQLAETQKLAAIEAQRQFSFGWNKAFGQYAEDATNAALVARDMFTSMTTNIDRSIRNLVENGKISFSDLASSIIKDIIRIQLQAQVSQAFSAIIGAIGSSIGGMFGSVNTMTIPQGTTMGAGTTAGGAGAVAFPVSLASGGYTGHGGQFEPAGIVHRGEYVLNAAATRRIGLSNLDKMNRGFASGGYAGGSMGGGVNINIKNEAGADGYKATAQARTNSDGGLNIDVLVRRVVSSDIQNNGALAQQMASTFGLRRSI